MVAGDGDCVWPSTTLDEADAFTHTLTHSRWTAILLINDDLLTLGAVMLGVEGMEHTVGSSLNSLADGVVATFVVVVAHFG